MTPDDARHLATRYSLDLTKDFFTLSASEVGRVLEAADFRRYRKPKQANGSRGRYFFAALQRAARKEA